MDVLEKIKKATDVLVGAELWDCRRTADLISFQFGDKQNVKTFRGHSAKVGTYAINVQCPWRIVEHDRIIVGSGDLYYPRDSNETTIGFNCENQPNRLDHLTHTLFGERRLKIIQVEVTLGASLRIVFEHAFALEIFPDDSSGEYWRLLKPGTDDEHFVVTEKGIQTS